MKETLKKQQRTWGRKKKAQGEVRGIDRGIPLEKFRRKSTQHNKM